MGNHGSLPTVNVINKTDNRIKVRVETEKSTLKHEYFGSTIGIGGGLKRLAFHESHPRRAPASLEALNAGKYDAFHISEKDKVEFTLIDSKKAIKADENEGGKQAQFSFPRDGWCHAFLTVLMENNNGSWNVICENHPIAKNSRVQIGSNVVVRQGYCNRDLEYMFGRIVVNNERKTKRNIWVKINSEPSEINRVYDSKGPEGKPVRKKAIDFSNIEDAENLVCYRVGVGADYTLIKNEGVNQNYAVFYLPIDRDFNVHLPKDKKNKDNENLYYLSIDYENDEGKIITKFINYRLQYRNLDGDDFSESVHIPRIYIYDEGDTIKFEVELERPTFRPRKNSLLFPKRPYEAPAPRSRRHSYFY
uniref:Uncharacterized protein n=1 Tax=Acrobeloides nanus TaxID=290746 RepID=A0A914CPF5_9BILA